MRKTHNVTMKLATAAILTASMTILAGGLLANSDAGTDWTAGEYEGTKDQTLELMGYYSSIELTPEQEAIRTEALTDMPAPCCKHFSAATCCCECNLSRSIWGLSKLLITEHDADAAKVRSAVEGWIAAINPEGYEGETCPTGRCGAPFKHDGCGGMQAHHLVTE